MSFYNCVEKPSRMEYDVDYVPTIFTYPTKSKASTAQSRLCRYKRLINRRRKALTTTRKLTTSRCKNKDDQMFVFNGSDMDVQQTIVLESSSVNGDTTQEQVVATDQTDAVIVSERSGDQAFDHSYANFNIRQSADVPQNFNEQEKASLQDKSSLEEERMTELEELISKQGSLITILKSEYQKALSSCSPFKRLEGDNEQTRFYTGLPSYKIFEFLLEKLKPISPTYDRHGLSAGDQLLLVMMKLRLATMHKDLAYRFGIHVSRVTKIFHHWIDVMSRELQQLISWPDHELVRKTLPDCFKPKYIRTKCIIDCSEVFIQRPTSLSARAETYSSYKSHNTVKFLVAISPTGAIIYVSKCWGGRVSDKHLTSSCGFLDKLMHGDLVLADRGFDISEELALHGATLAIPPFTKGKLQLSQREVEESRNLSRIRIHVERAIGRLKYYKILHSTLPIALVKRPYETNYATIDKILIVCSALCNIQPPLIT